MVGITGNGAFDVISLGNVELELLLFAMDSHPLCSPSGTHVVELPIIGTSIWAT